MGEFRGKSLVSLPKMRQYWPVPSLKLQASRSTPFYPANRPLPVTFALFHYNKMQYFRLEFIQFHRFRNPQRMPNPKPKKHLSKLNLTDEQQIAGDCQERLQSIIKTLRANNQRLLQKIEECDRKREQEQKINIKKNSQKCLGEAIGQHRVGQYESSCTTRRPMSQFKTERRMQRVEDQQWRKQNLANELPVKYYNQKSEECEDGDHEHTNQNHPKLIKINLKKLVPLSIDKLKERMRML